MSAALVVMEDAGLEAKKKDAHRRWCAAKRELKEIMNTAEYVAYIDDDSVAAMPAEIQARFDAADAAYGAAMKELLAMGVKFHTPAEAAKERRQRKQNGRPLAPAADTTALATVVQETCMTLRSPDELTDDQLADAVIQAFTKIRDYLPYIIALKARFNDGERDSANHLLTPIKGCYSWKEFCTSILNRAPESVREAIAAAKKPKTESHTVTESEFAEYEQENQGLRELTKKLLADGLPEADVVSALVNMGHPQPMADAAVWVVTAKKTETDDLNEIIKRLSPLMPVGSDGQLRLAQLLERVIACTDDPDEMKLRAVVNMLLEVSTHFAASAEALKRRIPVAGVA
jgi:hypothetical protein